MRHQYQFDTDTDREDRIALEVMKDGLKIALAMILSSLIMASVYWAAYNSDTISKEMKRFDAKVEHRINQVMK